MVSEDRRFSDCTTLIIIKDIALCLLDGKRMAEAKAAAALVDGTTPKYLVTVYARRAGEDGPPVSFDMVSLTPSRGNHGHLIWHLCGLGPLRQHLSLACRAPVRLVREVGQDGRVRLVVEPREEGEGGGGGKGEVPAVNRVEGSDAEAEGGEGVEGGESEGGGGASPEDSEPGSSDDEESSTNTGGGGGSSDSDWVPGGGDRQRTRGPKRLDQQQLQPPPEKVAGQQQPQQQQAQQQQGQHRRRHVRTAVHTGMQQVYAEAITVP